MNQKIVWFFFRTCARYAMRVLAFLSVLVADVACFYMSIFLPVPLSVCFYASVLTYGSMLHAAVTFLSITLLPCIIPVSWVFFMVPLVTVTLIGLSARSLMLTLWSLPYLLATLYSSVSSLVAYLNPVAPVLVPHL